MLDLSDDVARFKKLGGAWSVARHVHDALSWNARVETNVLLLCTFVVRVIARFELFGTICYTSWSYGIFCVMIGLLGAYHMKLL